MQALEAGDAEGPWLALDAARRSAPLQFHRLLMSSPAWASLDADAPKASLEMTNMRLRKWASVADGRVALNPALVWTDVAAFETASVAGDVEAALTHHRGPLQPRRAAGSGTGAADDQARLSTPPLICSPRVPRKSTETSSPTTGCPKSSAWFRVWPVAAMAKRGNDGLGLR